jgi:PEP-CTERM motif
MTTRTFCSGLILVAALGAPAAKADITENLVFTGTAICESGFFHQECPGGTVVSVTGNYTLDVTTQTVIGAWMFTSPFGSVSSTAPGASAPVIDGIIQGGTSYDIVNFQEETSTNNEVFDFGFTGAGAASELGAVVTFSSIVDPTIFFSGLCQNVPGSSPAGCEPDVNIAGATALVTSSVPEPSSFVLIGIAFALMGALLWSKRRAPQAPILR